MGVLLIEADGLKSITVKPYVTSHFTLEGNLQPAGTITVPQQIIFCIRGVLSELSYS
jgi:hypothetical protein